MRTACTAIGVWKPLWMEIEQVNWDEERNAVRQLGELIGYDRLISHASDLKAEPLKPVDLSRGHCIHNWPLNRECIECQKEQTNAGSAPRC